MLIICRGGLGRIGECEMAEITRDKSFQSRLCPFIETFEQGDSKSVLYAIMIGLIVEGISGELSNTTISIRIEFAWCGIGCVNSAIIV